MPTGSKGVRRITEAIERSDTQFGTRVADSTTNRIEISSTYPYNTDRLGLKVNGTFIRDDTTTTKFQNHPGKFELSPASGDTVILYARERLRYVPNYEMLWGSAAWYATQPTEGQRLFVEMTDDARENGYRYAFEPNNTRLEQLSGGAVVDTVPLADWGDFPNADSRDHNPLDEEGVDRTNPLNPRCYLAWYGVMAARYLMGYIEPASSDPRAPTLGYTANTDDIATEEINLNMKIVAEADATADGFTAYSGSMGALIRGNARQIDRSKNAPFWGLGGDISQYFTDNEPVLAARIDPTRPQVSVQLLRPEVNPQGTDIIEVLVGAVRPEDTDADFTDPDGDGTNEGTAPRAQSTRQNDVLQWTRNVSTFPTVTDIRRDGTTGLVPDVRFIADSVGAGGGNNKPGDSGIGGVQKQKVLYDDEIALFIPATDPTGTNATGEIKYLTAFTEQNW